MSKNVIDRKFKFVAVNPGNGRVVTEENGIVFCAHDKAFLECLPRYLEACLNLGADERQIAGVKELIERVEKYQSINGSKVPDVDSCKEAANLAGDHEDW